MLVLGVKKYEPVWIGEDIAVFVTEVRGDLVRLAFEAPRDVRILRDCVKERMQQDNDGLHGDS